MGKGVMSPADAPSAHSISTEVQGPVPRRKLAYEDVTYVKHVGGANVTNIGGAIPPRDISSIPFTLQCYKGVLCWSNIGCWGCFTACIAFLSRKFLFFLRK